MLSFGIIGINFASASDMGVNDSKNLNILSALERVLEHRYLDYSNAGYIKDIKDEYRSAKVEYDKIPADFIQQANEIMSAFEAAKNQSADDKNTLISFIKTNFSDFFPRFNWFYHQNVWCPLFLF